MFPALKHVCQSLLWYVEQDAEAYAILFFGGSFTAIAVGIAVLYARVTLRVKSSLF